MHVEFASSLDWWLRSVLGFLPILKEKSHRWREYISMV